MQEKRAKEYRKWLQTIQECILVERLSRLPLHQRRAKEKRKLWQWLGHLSLYQRKEKETRQLF